MENADRLLRSPPIPPLRPHPRRNPSPLRRARNDTHPANAPQLRVPLPVSRVPPGIRAWIRRCAMEGDSFGV